MLESENIVTLAVSEWHDQAEYAVETKSDHHEVMASVGAHNRTSQRRIQIIREQCVQRQRRARAATGVLFL